MFWDELKRVVKDPFMQGAIIGIGTYCILLIVVQKSLPTPNMSLNLSGEVMNALFEGNTLSFESNVGELLLTRVTPS